MQERHTMEPLWTVPDLAEFLQKSTSWVYKRTRRSRPGLLPKARVVGGEYRWERTEVLRWLANQ